MKFIDKLKSIFRIDKPKFPSAKHRSEALIPNKTLTAKELQQRRDKLTEVRRDGSKIRRSGELAFNTAPNRAQRRAEAKERALELWRKDMPVRNNRKSCGSHVFEKMAHFHMTIESRRQKQNEYRRIMAA